MAISDRAKRRAMDAVSHPETAAQKRSFLRRGGDAAVGSPVTASSARSPGGSLLGEMKRRAMDAISNVETVAQVGLIKMTGGIALYAARIREMDRGVRRDRAQPGPRMPLRTTRVEHLEKD